MNKYDLKRGFTLIELLVVISIILIASSIIFVGGNKGGGAALSSSQRIVSGIAQGARGQAILKNASVRLIIHNDVSEPDKYRRYFGIIYRAADAPGGGVKQWIAATQGTYLPEGVFFDAGTSDSESALAWSIASQAMRLEFPRAVPKAEGSGADFLYYEFYTNGTSATPNAYLVLRNGTIIVDVEGNEVSEIRVDPEDAFLRAALIFRRVGTTTLVSEPDAITPSNDAEIE